MSVALLFMALAGPAWGQDDACIPYGRERLRAELNAARAALDALQMARASSLLDELHRRMLCLDSVIEPADLAWYARAEAERAFYDQDTASVWRWAQLAMMIEPHPSSWSVAQDHPLRRLLVPDPDPRDAGPEDAGVAHPRKGGVFMDGVFLVEPLARVEVPHLVQVFHDEDDRSGAWWQDGAAFRDEVLVDEPSVTLPPKWFAASKAAEEGPLKDSRRTYRRYLKKTPGGPHAELARGRLDDMDWADAAEDGTLEAVRGYLEAWPQGRNREKAEQVLEGDDFRQAVAAGTREALEEFRERFPSGAYAAEITRRLDEIAWEDATRADTAEAYEAYRARRPVGAHVREARLAQEELEWRAADEDGSVLGYLAYLKRWPDGHHAVDARANTDVARFWRVAIEARTDGRARSVAFNAAQALVAHAKALGFDAYVRRRGAMDDPVPERTDGTGLLLVKIHDDGAGNAVQAKLQVWSAAVEDEPLSEVEVEVAFGRLVGPRLVEVMEPLESWKRPR